MAMGKNTELWISAERAAILLGLCVAILLSFAPGTVNSEPFSFKRWLSDIPSTLTLSVVNIDRNSGEVNINGGDPRQPGIPFTWDWRDGTIYDRWFPQSHTYENVTQNYVVTVTAHYGGGEQDSASILVRFVSPSITPISLPPEIEVFIPDHEISLTSRMPGYGIPENLTYFDESFFDITPRTTVEYVLTVAASLQKDFAGEDLFLVDGAFHQYLLRDSTFGGMYSLWYTSPVVFGVGDYGFQGSIGYSSFMHEMGHNFTLNTPADYIYGGKIDGNANAIYSETMANIFAHSTAYELLNHYSDYGLGEDLALEIRQSAISSIQVTRDAYEHYVNSGMAFHSWNDPTTPIDETFDTFQTLAFKFCEHSEVDGQGYREPLRRMMMVLQLFDEELHSDYDQNNNSSDADTMRATLMIAAMSFGFMKDLRAEFTALNFPIDDDLYSRLCCGLGPMIELLVPNGGETWIAGETDTVFWRSENSSGFLDIEYSLDGGSHWVEIAASAPDDGFYELWLPDTVSHDCLVKICDSDHCECCDASDGAFTIQPLAEEISFSYSMDAGWNMVSVPVETDGALLRDLFPGAVACWIFNGNYQRADEAAVGEGYWLLFDDPDTVKITGIPVTVFEKNMMTGWSLIGSCMEDMLISQVADVNTGEFPGWVSPLDVWRWEDGGYWFTEGITAGDAVWMLAQQGGAIRVSVNDKKAANSASVRSAERAEFGGPSTSHSASQPASRARTVGQWTVPIVVYSTIELSGANQQMYFGIDPAAIDELDALDCLCPPFVPGPPFMCSFFSAQPYPMLCDIHAAWNEADSFAGEIWNSETDTSFVKWSQTDLPAALSLSCDNGSETFDMKQVDSAMVVGSWDAMRRLFVGQFTIEISPSSLGRCGDVNVDSLCNSTDALIILSYDVELPIPKASEERIDQGYADINHDGSSNSTDALIVLSYDVGLPVPFPVCECDCVSPGVLTCKMLAVEGVKARVEASTYAVLPGEKIKVPVVVDMSNTAERLGSFSGRLSWNPQVFRYVGYSGGKAISFDRPAVNEDEVANGRLSFVNASVEGAGGEVNILNVVFEVIGTKGAFSPIEVSFRAMTATRSFNDLLAGLSVEGAKVSIIELPTTFALEQNYPNPFNPSTSIQFAVGSGQSLPHVTLKIFNLLGQEVAILVDVVKEPGYYSVTWDASDMPSGVYFCRLEAGQFIQTKRMLLIK